MSQQPTPHQQAAMARCVFCGQPEQIIWVHGHGQCAHCHTNSFPCCDGDECIPAQNNDEGARITAAKGPKS